VRRCPSGAITKTRKLHRGIEKAKINTKRCLPVVAQAHGCAVCMKVCPVQRYGLAAVYDHYAETGEILGTGTDELEGYTWPGDGRFYGPGGTPRVPASFFAHPELAELANFKE
jgi:NAD-dependent dihydropyrimidine dehydrogenase PreA subunit